MGGIHEHNETVHVRAWIRFVLGSGIITMASFALATVVAGFLKVNGQAYSFKDNEKAYSLYNWSLDRSN